MKKSILFSLMVIGAVAAMITAATTAEFSDTATSTGNVFSTGTLDLTVDGDESTSAVFGETGLVPDGAGDPGNAASTGRASMAIANTGSIDGSVDISGISVDDVELGACLGAEAAVPDSTCTDGAAGELSQQLEVTLCFADAATDDCGDPGTVAIYSGVLGSISASYDNDYALAAGTTRYIVVEWHLPNSATNLVQSDESTLDFTVELDQFDD
ncbi:MAG: hypothetical protein HY875_00415 [Chloroflexi bacterium]|nr:hypothetical protein [Chloroflexota bacterium]